MSSVRCGLPRHGNSRASIRRIDLVSIVSKPDTHNQSDGHRRLQRAKGDRSAQRGSKYHQERRATTFAIAVFENSNVMYSYSNISPKGVLVYLVTCAESCGG